MGSRYDIRIFHNTTLEQFMTALERKYVLGEVSTPWKDRSSIAISQIDTAAGSSVVIAAGPGESPRDLDHKIAERLGAETAFATVWDTVSHYRLEVVGPDVRRHLYLDAEEGDGVMQSGTLLPEEPSWPPLDESYIQSVFTGRYGIDPGRIDGYDTTWYEFLPVGD